MATVVTVNSITSVSDKPIHRLALSGRYDKVVWIYLAGALFALLPVFGVGSWQAAFVRLGLAASSVVIYFAISRFFRTTVRLTWLLLAISGGLVIVAILGTAQVNTTSLRLSGLNYQIYAALAPLRKLLPASFPHVHQNVLAGLLATFVPPVLALGWWGQRWWQRLYAGTCAVIVVGLIIVSSSRGALIGLGAGILGLVWFGLAKYPRLRSVFYLTVLILAVPALVFLLLNVLPGVDNGTNRLQLWQNTSRLIGDYPFTGAGLGQFELQSSIHGLPDKHAHNLFLQSWVEFGLAGFVAILLLVLLVARLLWQYRRLDEIAVGQKPIMIGALCGLLAMFGDGLVEYGSWGGKFAPAFLVLPALLTACNLTLPPFHFATIPVHKWVWLPLGVLGMFLLVPLLLINVGSIVSSPQLFEVTATLAPWNATPLRSLGRLALQRGDEVAAQTYYTAALTRDDGDWKNLMLSADFAEKQANHAQAVAYWRKAEAATYFIQQANQPSQSAQSQTNEKDLKLALEIQPDNLEAAQMLVGIYASTNRKAAAQALLQNLLAQRPTASLYEQAASLATTKQQGIDFLQQAIKADSKNSGYYWELGNTYGLEQPDLAEQAYKHSLELRPDFQWPVRSLADLYLAEKQPQAAIAELAPFIAKGFFIESPGPEYTILAEAYLATNNYDAAVSAAQKAVQSSPYSVKAFLTLGDSWLSKGDKIQARTAYQKVLQLEPNNTDASNKLEEIGKNG